jgi:hypothetical protein
MGSRPETRKLLHDVQAKCASLKSASQLIKDCAPEKAREMLALMTQEARDLLKCLYELRKEIDQKPV